jgi:hypothetical protein
MSILPNGDIHLFWPIESGTGWTLMGSTTMAAGSWSPVNAPVTQRGGYFQVTIPGTNRAFFRLDRPSGGGGEEM